MFKFIKGCRKFAHKNRVFRTTLSLSGALPASSCRNRPSSEPNAKAPAASFLIVANQGTGQGEARPQPEIAENT